MASYETPSSVSKAVKKATLKRKIKASAAKDAPKKEASIAESDKLVPADTQDSPKKKVATSTTPGQAGMAKDMAEYKKQDRLLGNTFAKIKKFEKEKKRAFMTSPKQSERIKNAMKKYKEHGKNAGVKDLGKYDVDFGMFKLDEE